MKSYVGRFFTIMRPLIVLGNIFGIIPLQNFTAKDPGLIKFSWKSLQLIYSVVVQLLISVLFATSFYKQVVYRVEFDKLCKF